jgi:hypothetical protein
MATEDENQVGREINFDEVESLADALKKTAKKKPLITLYGMDVIYLRRDIAIKNDMSNLSFLLTPLYAVMLLYGQSPSKMQIEKFNFRPYCGCHLCCRLILPLGSSVAKVWLGRMNSDDLEYRLIFIEGKGYERYNIVRAIKYYFFTKYGYREEEHYSTDWNLIYYSNKMILKEEMKSCKKIGQDNDKVLEWIIKGKKAPIPGGCREF